MTLLVLWDVDHTLIDNAGVSKLIYASAFQELAGRQPAAAAPTEGRTDRSIIRTLFEAEGLDAPPWPQAEAALVHAGTTHRDLLVQRGYVLPGVRKILEKLATDCRIVQSLLTGNIRQNAAVKLAPFGLDSFLNMDLGAYGADALHRPDLVPVAIARYTAAFGDRPTATLLIGDTPRDIEAAKASGASIIAVATGIHSPVDLRAAGAELILDDLADVGSVLAAIGSFAKDV